jgi:hypothetical protein
MLDIGNRHKLIVYSYTLDQWWRLIFFIGVFLVTISVSLGYLPIFQPARLAHNLAARTLGMLGGTGAFTLLVALFLATISGFAYVQPYKDHLRLVTPFLRLKISYRRINQATSVQFEGLFPPPYKRFERSICRQLARYTAIVLDLNGLPLPRPALLLFLSPLFFPDQTPRLALLVPDWIKFSNELESFKGAWMQAQQPMETDPRQSLYASITNRGDDGW